MSPSRRLVRWALLAVLTVPSLASAQLYNQEKESPRNHQIEIKFGPYKPSLYAKGASNTPYDSVFGGSSMFIAKLEYDYQFFQKGGSLAVGFEMGIASITGDGLVAGTSTASTDETKFRFVPFSVSLVYHMDLFATKWDVPLVPYVKVGFDYVVWWITDGVGDIAHYKDPKTGEDFEGRGDTWGYHVAAGLKILLDVLSPSMARTFDVEVGVNNSYIFAEFLYADISDFGSGGSFNLGAITGLFGLAFEF